MTDIIRIVLADDHTVLRSGLRLLLDNQPHLQVVAEASNGIQALSMTQQHQPDVLLLDINMPEADGLSIIPQVRQTSPQTKILILTMHEDWQLSATSHTSRGGGVFAQKSGRCRIAHGDRSRHA